MSGSQQLRLFIEDRLTAAAVEIFGVVEKTISEYEEQVVQSKRELEQLKQDIRRLNTVKTHIQMCRIASQPVSEVLLPLQELSPRQELMSSQEDVAVQHLSPLVKEEQVTDSHPVSEELLPLQLNPRELMSSQEDEVIQQQSPQVKEEQVDLNIEQVDLNIIPHFENSIYNNGTNRIKSEIASDSQLIPSYTMATVLSSHDVANKCNESEGLGLTFSQSDDDVFSMVQKICRFCRQQCRSYSDLEKHVEESHIGQRAFKCPECDKEFARRVQFSIHYRIHTGEKRHSCPVCGKLFTQRSNLVVHMRIHTGVKPHSCPGCKKSFSRSTTLKDHMMARCKKTCR